MMAKYLVYNLVLKELSNFRLLSEWSKFLWTFYCMKTEYLNLYFFWYKFLLEQYVFQI